jgi:hypothetical protein
MEGATMGPDEMVRIWHAAAFLRLILWCAVIATAAAVSVFVQFEVVPAVERWIWRAVGVKS